MEARFQLLKLRGEKLLTEMEMAALEKELEEQQDDEASGLPKLVPNEDPKSISFLTGASITNDPDGYRIDVHLPRASPTSSYPCGCEYCRGKPRVNQFCCRVGCGAKLPEYNREHHQGDICNACWAFLGAQRTPLGLAMPNNYVGGKWESLKLPADHKWSDWQPLTPEEDE